MEVLHINYSVQETECFKVSRDLWVIAQRELTLDHEGKWQKPTALSPPLSPSLYVCFASLRPSAQADWHHTENLRLYHSCGVVSDGCTVWPRTEWQTVWALLCHCSARPRTAMTGGERLALCYGPPGTAVGFYEESRGRNAAGGEGGGSQRFADLQITHGKKQIGLIWEHARTCARRKGHREPCCRRLSQWLQLLHTPKKQHTSDRIPAMHLSLLHFLRLDLGSLAQQVKVKGSS